MDNRYYFSIQAGDVITFTGQEAKHLSLVRRAKIGEQIVGFNGDGKDYLAKISAINKQEVSAQIIQTKPNRAHQNKKIAVYLAMIKNDALTTTIDQLAELNVSDVYLFKADRSVAVLDGKKLEKLNAISLQASKQCERADIMGVHKIEKSQIKAHSKQFKNVFFAYEDSANQISAFTGDFAVIIGPEGGFTKQEVEHFSAFANQVSLGQTILRAQVASLVAVCKLQAKSE